MIRRQIDSCRTYGWSPAPYSRQYARTHTLKKSHILTISFKVVVGQEIVVVEAMKMQNVLRAHRDGVIKKVFAKAGVAVAVDEILVEFQ